MAIEIPSRERYEQAAEWLLKVQAEGAPPEVFAEMLAWCDEDPRNKAAMERIEEAWAVTGEVKLDSRLRGNDELDRGNDELDRGNGKLDRGNGKLDRFRDRLRGYGALILGGAVASLALAVGIAVLGTDEASSGLGTSPGERVVTARGAHEKATLPDGSRVELGGKSSMSVVYSPQRRVIVAEDGEAFFTVSKDPDRPFMVRAGPVTVTAVGTAFSVTRSGESVSVVVTEGVVDVATESLSVRAEAGQRVRYDRGLLSQALDEVPLEVATSWREGRLQFVDEPLRLVIASVNRYSEREVLISDPAIEELRFTGTVFERGVENWLNGVASVFPVRIIPIDKRRVMIAPAQS